MKKFKPRIKARLRKSKIDIKKKLTVVTEKAKVVKNKTDLKTNIKNFFDWVKGAELVELEKCNISEDPVRPELDNIFRTNFGRKIFSRLFKVSYKPQKDYLGVLKFNNLVRNTFKKLIPLGGINLSNLGNLNNVSSDFFAIMSEVKKKPAKIFSRLF